MKMVREMRVSGFSAREGSMATYELTPNTGVRIGDLVGNPWYLEGLTLLGPEKLYGETLSVGTTVRVTIERVEDDVSEIKPALTPEQWERREASFFGINMRLEEDGVGFGVADCETIFDDEERHALAALCLHGQPFGFTRDDVDELWSAIADGWDGLKSLADRIEALLPPGEQKP